MLFEAEIVFLRNYTPRLQSSIISLVLFGSSLGFHLKLEKNSVLLYNGRIDKMWDISWHEINIFSMYFQQATHLSPTSTNYHYFPHLCMWGPSWGFVDGSWLSWGQCVGKMLRQKKMEKMLIGENVMLMLQWVEFDLTPTLLKVGCGENVEWRNVKRMLIWIQFALKPTSCQ